MTEAAQETRVKDLDPEEVAKETEETGTVDESGQVEGTEEGAEEDETAEEGEEDEAPRSKIYKSTESLKVELTDEELRTASEEMARAVDDIRELEGQRKATVESFKARIAKAQADCQVNANLVRNKYEFRRVDVERTFDYEHGTVTAVRLDTYEVFESRKMTGQERQMTF